MMIICSPITKQNYEAYYDLRWKILRKPWNQPAGTEKDNREETSSHFMAITDNGIIGVARLHMEKSIAVIRYMAVDIPYQRKGIGSKLLNHLELEAGKLNATTITLNARAHYLQFYLNNGYRDCGASHTLYNAIRHRKMIKTILSA